jgi:Protein of unknown function (DUF2510)
MSCAVESYLFDMIGKFGDGSARSAVGSTAPHLRLVDSVDSGPVESFDDLEDAPNPARWLGDPTGRNELRYWDGRSWSAKVANAGVFSTDPVRTR